jgi:hypothetical protein
VCAAFECKLVGLKCWKHFIPQVRQSPVRFSGYECFLLPGGTEGGVSYRYEVFTFYFYIEKKTQYRQRRLGLGA